MLLLYLMLLLLILFQLIILLLAQLLRIQRIITNIYIYIYIYKFYVFASIIGDNAAMIWCDVEKILSIILAMSRKLLLTCLHTKTHFHLFLKDKLHGQQGKKDLNKKWRNTWKLYLLEQVCFIKLRQIWHVRLVY